MHPAVLALMVVYAAAPGGVTAQKQVVDPATRMILDYRLTVDKLAKIGEVVRNLDRLPPGLTEAARAELAVSVVLVLGFSDPPYTERTVSDVIQLIEKGPQELVVAIASAGMSTRDYVLTQMVFLLAYRVVVETRQGRTVATPNVSTENLEFVERHWVDADRLMGEITRRVDQIRRR